MRPGFPANSGPRAPFGLQHRCSSVLHRCQHVRKLCQYVNNSRGLGSRSTTIEGTPLGSPMAELARRAALSACLLIVLVALAGCSSADAQPCPVDATLTYLCVVNADGAIAIDRLAATNLADRTQDIRPDPENPQNSLVDVRVEKDSPLTVAIGPTEGLFFVEFWVYPSKHGLDEATPLLIVECDVHGCDRWSRSKTSYGLQFQIPPADLASGNVVVAHAWVDRVNESGTVSWGLLIDSD